MDKSFLLLLSCEKHAFGMTKKKAFFFEKKKQKTFIY